MTEPRGQEQLKLEEIPLEPQTARALGNGLRKIFPDNKLLGILVNIMFLKKNLSTDQYKNDLDIIELHTTKIRDFINNFGKSRDVKLANSDATGWDFIFSEDKVPKTQPQPGEIPLSEDLSDKLRKALDHNLGNRFASILGYAEVISSSSNDLNAKGKSDSIMERGALMISNLKSVTQVAQERCQMKLLTDTQGITTIS